MTERLSIALRARRRDGPVRTEEILGPLGLEIRLAAVTGDQTLSSARLELSQGLGPEESIRRVTRWLTDHRFEAFEVMRSNGLELDLEIIAHGGRLAFRIPVELLTACSRRELPISVISPSQG